MAMADWHPEDDVAGRDVTDFVSPPHTFTPSFRRKSAHCTPYLRLEMGIGRRLELFEDGSDFEERQTDYLQPRQYRRVGMEELCRPSLWDSCGPVSDGRSSARREGTTRRVRERTRHNRAG